VKDINDHLASHLCYFIVQIFVEKFFQKLLNFYSRLFSCPLVAASMRRSYIHCLFHIIKCTIKNQSEQASVADFNDHLASNLCYLNVQTFVEKFFQMLFDFYSELFTCHLVAASKRFTVIFVFENASLKTKANIHP